MITYKELYVGQVLDYLSTCRSALVELSQPIRFGNQIHIVSPEGSPSPRTDSRQKIGYLYVGNSADLKKVCRKRKGRGSKKGLPPGVKKQFNAGRGDTILFSVIRKVKSDDMTYLLIPIFIEPPDPGPNLSPDEHPVRPIQPPYVPHTPPEEQPDDKPPDDKPPDDKPPDDKPPDDKPPDDKPPDDKPPDDKPPDSPDIPDPTDWPSPPDSDKGGGGRG